MMASWSACDGAEHVAHPGRPAAAQAGDEGGLVVERGVPFKPVRGEHLVPVVADPAAGPAIPAAAGQAHRVGVGRSEERLGRGGAPVEQQPAARAVREAKPSDVHGLGVVRADHVSQAQVQAEAAQDAQASGQPVDLHVPVHRLLADAAGRLALGIEAVGQVGDRLLEALRDGREVLLVAGDQRRVGLGGEAVGKVKRAGSQGVHVISSDLRSRASVARRRRLDRRDEPGGCPSAAPAPSRCPVTRSPPAPRPRPGTCRSPQRLTSLRLAEWHAVRRPRATRTPTATHAFRDPVSVFCPRPAIMRHDPGLAASPPVRYILKVERSISLSFPYVRPAEDGPASSLKRPRRVR